MPADTVKHTPLACCPFCGETPSEIVDATKILGVYRVVHRCKVIPPFVLEAATPEKVAAAWNRRAPDPVREKLVEALRFIVIECGGKAIPNESLTACRNRALAVLAEVDGGSNA